MKEKKTAKGKIDFYNSPLAWFCELETARKKDDYARAAKAYRNLKRLGVVVKYRSRAANEKITSALQELSKAKLAGQKSPKAQTIIRSENV